VKKNKEDEIKANMDTGQALESVLLKKICKIQGENSKKERKKDKIWLNKDTCLDECPPQKCVKSRARIPPFL